MKVTGSFSINNSSAYDLRTLVGRYKIFNGKRTHVFNVKSHSNTYDVFMPSGEHTMRIIKDPSDNSYTVYSADNLSKAMMIFGREFNTQYGISPLGRLSSKGFIPMKTVPSGSYIGSCEQGFIHLEGLFAKKKVYINDELIASLELRQNHNALFRSSKISFYTRM